MRVAVRSLLATMVLMTAFACTNRRVDTELQEKGAFYLEVHNPMPHAMKVSFTVGAGEATALGTVQAGATQRFTLATLSNSEIEVIATDMNETHTVRKTVDLERGEVVRVSITQD